MALKTQEVPQSARLYTSISQPKSMLLFFDLFGKGQTFISRDGKTFQETHQYLYPLVEEKFQAHGETSPNPETRFKMIGDEKMITMFYDIFKNDEKLPKELRFEHFRRSETLNDFPRITFTPLPELWEPKLLLRNPKNNMIVFVDQLHYDNDRLTTMRLFMGQPGNMEQVTITDIARHEVRPTIEIIVIVTKIGWLYTKAQNYGKEISAFWNLETRDVDAKWVFKDHPNGKSVGAVELEVISLREGETIQKLLQWLMK